MAHQTKLVEQTRLVEEVPGVPPDEQWFLWRGRKVEKHFPTLQAGKDYCAGQGIVIDQVERFEP